MDLTNANRAFLEEMEYRLTEWIRNESKPTKNKNTLIKSNISAARICEKATRYYNLIRKRRDRSLRESISNVDNLAERPIQLSNGKFNQEWYADFSHRALKQKNLQLPLFPKPPKSVSTSLADKLHDLVSSGEYTRKQIWVGAHFGLFYQRMPDGSKLAPNDTKPGRKKNYKHLSILLTANVSEDIHQQLKPLVCHHDGENSKWANDNDITEKMILASDKPNARLTKSIMLRWLRKNFHDEAQAYCAENNLKFKVILFLSECFREYFTGENLNPSIQLLFFTTGEEDSLVFDTKSTIVEPFIANYMSKIFIQLETEQDIYKNEKMSINELWNQFNAKKACHIIDQAFVENHLNHIESMRSKLCLYCSPLLNSNYTISSSQQQLKKQDHVLQAVELAEKLKLDVNIFNLTDLIDFNLYQLNDHTLIEDLHANTTGADQSLNNSQVLPPVPEQTLPPITPIKGKPKGPSISEQTTELMRIQRDNLAKVLDHLEKAASILNPTDAEGINQLDESIKHFNEKLESVKHDLRHSAALQPKIDSFFHFTPKSAK